MPQRRKPDSDVECPNPNCTKKVVGGKARWADCAPNDVVRYSRSERRIVIGHTYFHEDGTLCDMSLFSIKFLPGPVFLRLGDSKVDPRN